MSGNTSKLILGTIATMIATASAVHAAPVLGTSVVAEESGADISRLSNTAREQILDRSHLQLARSGRPGFVQEFGPAFVQWRAQGILIDMRPAPLGDVRLAFERARTHNG
jgi:hypothetical protein